MHRVNLRREPFLGQSTPVVNLVGTDVDQRHTHAPSLTVNRDTVRAYLTEMYLDVPGLLQIWTTPRKGSGEFFPTTDEGIEQAVTSINASYTLSGEQSIYARITTVKAIPSETFSRGVAADSASFIGLWTDVDFGTVGHKGGDIPPDAAAAQAVYDASGLPEASITVHSGGGLYHIVKLDQPVDITDTDVRMRINALSRRWQYKVAEASEKLGYKYGTGVADLARVLRIPGTVNAKVWAERRRTAYMSSGARYTLAELEAACPVPPRPARRIADLTTGEPAKDARARFDHHLADLRATTFERNNALNRLAFMSYQYVAAGQLTEDEVEREFTAAGLDCGLDESEVRATVNSAKAAGLQKPYVWRTLTSTRTEHREDLWGPEDAAGHARQQPEPPPTEPKPQAQQEPPTPPTPPVSTQADGTGGEGDGGDSLADTRLPEITDKFRAPSDKKPYTVATHLKDSFFLHNGKPTLMRWQDIWVRWNGSCWGSMSDADVTSWLYQRMDAAYMMVQDKDTKEWVEAPWNPANSSITNLDKALRAAVNLRDDTKQNTMVGGRSQDLAISCTNGLLRVTGRELTAADPAYFTFSSVPFAYDKDAACPEWMVWLKETFEHDPDSISMLQEFFGYVLSGRTDLQKALMLQGPERSGKGTIARILQMLAGWSNCAGPTLNSLTEQFGMWALTDKTLAVIGDARLPKRGTEVITERLLSIIGEDTIQVDRKYQRPWEGKIPARLVLLTNEIPNWSDSAGVLPTRWIVATTAVSHLGREDTTLIGRLATELPGILNWALDGLDRLITQQRFTVNAATPEIVGAQRDRSAPQKGFIAEVCVLGDDKWVSKERLREMWVLWNQGHGRTITDTRESFTTKLIGMVPVIKARDQKKRVNGKLIPVYRGVGLIIDDPEAMAERDRAERETETEPEPTSSETFGQQTLPDPEPSPTDDTTVPPPREGAGRHEDAARSSVNTTLRTVNRPTNTTRHRSEQDRQ